MVYAGSWRWQRSGKGAEEDSGKLWSYKLRPVEATGLRLLSGSPSGGVLCRGIDGLFQGSSGYRLCLVIHCGDFSPGFLLGVQARECGRGALSRSLVA